MSHSPGGRLPLLSAMPAVTFPAAEHHRRFGRYQIQGGVLKCDDTMHLVQGSVLTA